MKIVKLTVFICFVRIVCSIRGRYCGISNNHTLCKYPLEGPSSVCVSYDKSARLSNKDIIDLVARINERRHLVAMGSLSRFPQAANMKKMRWSRKLARFAQRWVDQCDRSIKPNKEDENRDLVNMSVGQAVASVLGPSPGLNVRSFVDVWFIQNLNYRGSVTYYNQSKDFKSDYFTQLIWADTAFVGCGRANFWVEDLNTIVERVVCNFAPRGNTHGKPIYTIGYPGTQCPDQMIPDIEFPSLCQHAGHGSETKFIDKGAASSLLRILNLSNNSVKQELDPNYLKQIHLNSSKINEQRHQKTRHVYLNNSYGAMKRDSIHLQNPMRNVDIYNEPQFTQREYTQERGHSRLYHGYQATQESTNFDFSHTDANYRRIDFTTPAPLYSNSFQDARKHYVDQCTRNIPTEHNCFSPVYVSCKTNECTRGLTSNCPHATPCQHTSFSRIEQSCGTKCPCIEITHPTAPTQCGCNRKCEPTSKCASYTTTNCPYRRAGNDKQDNFKQFEYYDLFHNIEVRSGDEDLSLVNNSNPDKVVNSDYNRRESDSHSQVKAFILRPKTLNLEDSYRSSDYSERKKRDLEEQIFKPFWQMDEYDQKRASQLKSIRYTTLAHKRNKKTSRTSPSTRLPTITETITIKPNDSPAAPHKNRGRITEKYLSFDELMYLRKLSTAETLKNLAESNTDARRKGKPLRDDETTVDPEKTTTLTANTPFLRQKYCTRKVTCTWTDPRSASGGGSGGDGSGGSGVGGGGGYNVGSRTPPGYVEGCSRTSTCTRIYADRNILPTSSDEAMATTLEDEDYCERRSLNIRRRNLDEHGFTISSIGYQEAYTELPLLTTKINDEMVVSQDNSVAEISSHTANFRCICYDDATRVKRREVNYVDHLLSKDCNKDNIIKTLPNNDAYHTAAHTNFRSKNNKISYQCPCNGTKSLLNMFYRALMLKYCATWMFYHIFIVRTFDG